MKAFDKQNYEDVLNDEKVVFCKLGGKHVACQQSCNWNNMWKQVLYTT